ncbi:MAG: 4Fe-4S dicluster domain-containing protein [Deltaproteobacteria bacterium]|nr:4Fe-4S dicluster domain-containing protein [Deltaproteobacteria bacterium]
MNKRLQVTPARCIGCRTCEIACAFSHPAAARPGSPQGGGPGPTRIRAYPIKPPESGVPVVCLQCDSAACVRVCPTQALQRDDRTGAILVSEDRCILCRACVWACPWGNVGYDEGRKVIHKCDLCAGDPQCARYCPSRALETFE